MSEFKIIDNIEMPEPAQGRGKPFKYPFTKLAVGQGFEVPDNRGKNTHGSSRAQNNIATCAAAVARKHGMKFQTAKIGDVIRVKRIA